MPDEDIAFLRAYSAEQGISAEELLARQAHNLREHIQRVPHPDVAGASGIISPDVAGEDDYRTYLEKKHS